MSEVHKSKEGKSEQGKSPTRTEKAERENTPDRKGQKAVVDNGFSNSLTVQTGKDALLDSS